MKTKINLRDRKTTFKYAIKGTIGTISLITACYGFWGCLFPDLTLVEGTYRFVIEEEYQQEEHDTVDYEKDGADEETYGKDTEQLYADILDGKVKVTYRSKLFELFEYIRGIKK